MWNQAWVDSVRVPSGNGANKSRVLGQGGVLILDVGVYLRTDRCMACTCEWVDVHAHLGAREG